MFWMTVFMTDSTHMPGCQELGVPLFVSISMHTEPPAVTCPVYLQHRHSLDLTTRHGWQGRDLTPGSQPLS